LAYELVNNIGPEKFLYSTKAKLKFLENKISVNPLNGLGGQTPLPENKRTQSSFLTNRQMEDNKTFHTHINIRGYEEDYNTKKMVFLMNNPEKTEKNFIENTIMEINSQNLEWERKCNLTEDEVYNECKNNKRYIDSVENGFDKEKYLEPLLKELAYAFKRRYNKEGITNKPSTRSIFYKFQKQSITKNKKKKHLIK
jgi:hypothetical protein